MVTKRIAPLILVFCMLLPLFAGCASTPETAADTKPATEAVTAAKVTSAPTEASEAPTEEEKTPTALEIWMINNDYLETWDNEIKPKFESEYPWITVEAVGVGELKDEYILTRITSGMLPDIWRVDNTQTYYNAVDEGLLRDLNELPVSQDIPQAYRDAFTYNGKLFGLTQGAAFSTLYLNMKILEDAGWTTVPGNWDEFIQCCADIKDKTGTAPLTLAGDKTTTCWMLLELITCNVVGDELGLGGYEEAFLNGTFDFTKYPLITERLEQVVPYILTGTASMTEDDVTAAMTDGTAAMCLAGNWTSNNICSGIETASGDAKYVKAMLAPFNSPGKDVWISVSPETGVGLCAAEAEPNVVEAREIFLNWLFQPENWKMIQNARGTVPVLSTLAEEDIVLPAPIAAIVPDMNAAKFVKMGFNLWTDEFRDSACTALKDVYGGNLDAATAITDMSAKLATSHKAGN